ncbi:FRG domain-containing protein [Burkholderia cenocepacia]|nr:FRG domain-containing protein [Burkholderia cenocepacia]
MELINQHKIWSFRGDSPWAEVVRGQDFRKAEAHGVVSYFDLATKVAELQFRNSNHILLFRGQSCDYRNKNNYTSLKPSLLRGNDGKNPGISELQKRFAVLEKAERILIEECESARLLGVNKVQRLRIVRWSILQHYEVCGTPLLDVTHSLRVAASFASHGAGDEAYVFVLGVPNLGGGITASAEAGLQAVRLSSICPPSAVRPHIQEGYLLGEYPDMSDFSQKSQYLHYETDFGRRLIAKFKFNPEVFWRDNGFPIVGKDALYPEERNDPLLALMLRVKKRILEREI